MVGYYIFVDGDTVYSESKKQTVVTRSAVESEYQTLTPITCELIWLKHLSHELDFLQSQSMDLLCVGEVAIHIASNLV